MRLEAGPRGLGLQRRRGTQLSAIRGLNARQIGELVDEARPLCVGRRVREAAALPPRDLLLVLERPDGQERGPTDSSPPGEDETNDGPPVVRLLLSADPDAPRLHLVQDRLARHSGARGPFYRTVQGELEGAFLADLAQIGGDRLVRASFRRPGGDARSLVAELTGRHANLALLDESDRVLAVLVPPPAREGAPRLAPGAPWTPPPGRPPGGTPPGVREHFPEPAQPPPAVRRDHPPFAPLSWRVESALGPQVAARDRTRRLADLRRRIERRIARARSALAGLDERERAVEQAERLRRDGELLKAVMGELRRGQRKARVSDWFEGGRERTIELDPKRTPRENVERIFARYRKLVRAAENLHAERARAEARLAELEAFAARLAAADTDPQALESEALERGLLEPRQQPDPRKRQKPAPRLPYRSFRGLAGSEIRVGRSARDNDALTFRHARGNDLWLHTRDAPGSHVVLVLAGRQVPDPEELMDAAHLAVHFSPLRGATRAAVHVARQKEVRKPRGAKPGLVHLAGGRTLELVVQPQRLARLLGGNAPPGEPTPRRGSEPPRPQ